MSKVTAKVFATIASAVLALSLLAAFPPASVAASQAPSKVAVANGIPSTFPGTAMPNSCRNSLWLTPHTIDGWPWEEHRHWLEAPIPINGSYVIIDMTHYVAWNWSNWGTTYPPGNHTRFGVSTTYTLLNPGWMGYAWYLLYNC